MLKKINYLNKIIIKKSNLKLSYIFCNYSSILNFFYKNKIIITKYNISIFLIEIGYFFILRKFLFLFNRQKLLK